MLNCFFHSVSVFSTANLCCFVWQEPEVINAKNAKKTKDIRQAKKDLIGDEEFTKQESAKKSEYRTRKMEEKIQKGYVKKTPDNANIRKQKQKEREIERYGIERYKKINALQARHDRAKKAGKDNLDERNGAIIFLQDPKFVWVHSLEKRPVDLVRKLRVVLSLPKNQAKVVIAKLFAFV